MREIPELCPRNELLIDRRPGFLVRFANKAYSWGYDHGARDKASDIRSALGI
ncbi:MAG TPA: hypothetical protein VLH39_05515 [Magnetospirillaceae bacterium]|nr:hypothetical protein [Magnetospirillaceae bacterium]